MMHCAEVLSAAFYFKKRNKEKCSNSLLVVVARGAGVLERPVGSAHAQSGSGLSDVPV